MHLNGPIGRQVSEWVFCIVVFKGGPGHHNISGDDTVGVPKAGDETDLEAKLAKLDKIGVKRGRDSDMESDDDEGPPKRIKEYTETEPVFLGESYRRIGWGWHVKGEHASFRLAKWFMRTDRWEPDFQKKINLNVKELKALFGSMDKILEEGQKAHKLEKERLAAIEKEEKEDEKHWAKSKKSKAGTSHSVFYKRGRFYK